MNIKGLIRAITLGIAITAPAAAHASLAQTSDLALSNHGQSCGNILWKNSDLTSGSYAFANIHLSGKSFFDEWTFSVATTSNIEVSLFDLLLPNGDSDYLLPQQYGLSHKYEHQDPKHLMKSLLDNKFLTVSLFDNDGNLLGTAGENGMLSALSLAAGEWYTLGVSGKAVGLIGGVYYGNLNVQSVSQVPIGDTLPLFTSALLVLGLRSKKIRSALRS